MSVDRNKIVEISKKLTREEAETMAFLADLSKDFERTPFKVLEKMYEKGLTKEYLIDNLKEIDRKDLVALVEKKPKPRNSRAARNEADREALSSLLEIAAFNLARARNCLELENGGASLSERDLRAVQRIEEENGKIKQCLQDRLLWSGSSESSGGITIIQILLMSLIVLSSDERTSTQAKKPIFPPKNRTSEFILA